MLGYVVTKDYINGEPPSNTPIRYFLFYNKAYNYMRQRHCTRVLPCSIIEVIKNWCYEHESYKNFI